VVSSKLIIALCASTNYPDISDRRLQPPHSVEQQLCRWLLLSHDRVDTDELIMTQELIADMLGVRCEGVTVAAGHLQDVGAISYVRGRIQILDRQKLEETACECYRVVKRSSIAYLDNRGASHRRPSMVNE